MKDLELKLISFERGLIVKEKAEDSKKKAADLAVNPNTTDNEISEFFHKSNK